MGAAVADIDHLLELTTPRMTQFIPHAPTPRQAAFLLLDAREIMYGGSAGGGKSDALLMAGLQYVDVPGYAGILFRRSYADLALPGALMDRAYEWLNPSGAHWSESQKRWEFPSGASLSFGYLETPRDKYRYQSAEFQFVGFDELTQFDEEQYLYLFSRLRRLADSEVPIRMRSASNPGGVGHAWVKERFITTHDPERRFVRASLKDNPYVDQTAYLAALGNLDAVTRAQLRDGDWNATTEGSLFKRLWFRDKIITRLTAQPRWCRYWDFAATKSKKADWTAGGKLGLLNGEGIIADMRRLRGTGKEVEDLVRQTAYTDGWQVPIVIEVEKGSAGKLLFDHYVRNILPGFNVRGDPPVGQKVTRMLPLSALAEQGHLFILKGAWNEALLDEGELITRDDDAPYDDQWDALSGAYLWLTHVKAKRHNGILMGSKVVPLYAR